MGLFRSFLDAVATTGDSREEHRKLRRRWQGVARRRGGTYNEQRRTLLGPPAPTLDVTAGSVAIHVDTFIDDVGGHSVISTRFRGAYLLSSGPSFKVFYSRLAKIFGSADGKADAEIGYRVFDEHFMVHTRELKQTRAAWSLSSAKKMMRFFSTGRVETDGEMITLTTEEVVVDSKALDAGIDVVSELGRWGATALDEARQLAGARWIDARGSWDARHPPTVQVEVLGVTLSAEPLVVNGSPSLTLFVTPERHLEIFAIDLDEEIKIAGDLDDLMTTDARSALGGVGKARLISKEDRLRIELDGEPTARRLDAATRLLAELARTPRRGGAYR